MKVGGGKGLAILEKCAVALGCRTEDLVYRVNLIVVASSEEMMPGRVLNTPAGRKSVVMPLTREEWDVCRQFNRFMQERQGRGPARWRCAGERADIMRDAPELPEEPPAEYWHYLCREA